MVIFSQLMIYHHVKSKSNCILSVLPLDYGDYYAIILSRTNIIFVTSVHFVTFFVMFYLILNVSYV